MPTLQVGLHTSLAWLMAMGIGLVCARTARAVPVDEVRLALERMHQWVDAGPNGAGWRDYLQSAALEAELAKGDAADPAVVGRILGRYASGVTGLDLPRFVKVRAALARWLARLAGPSFEELAAAAIAAKRQFHPITAHDVDEARAALEAAAKRLDARLTEEGASGQSWRDYLLWDRMQAELARGSEADLNKLDEVYFRYASGHEGLELRCFGDVRVALRAYLTVARAQQTEGLKEGYGQLLDMVAAHLKSLPKIPSAEQTEGLARAIRWLCDARQARGLVEQIRGAFGRANLLVDLSAAVIRAAVDRPVDDTAPVVDVILKTDIRGTGRTVGRLTAELVPNDRQAELEVVLRGVTRSDTVGSNGPARIYSDGVTTLEARKRVLLGAGGVEALPSRAEAETRSTVQGVCLVRGGKLVEKIARQRVCRQKSEAECIANLHAEQRINARLDEEVERAMGEASRRFDEKFIGPLEARGWMPDQLDTSTTAETLRMVAMLAGPAQLAAPVEAPPLVGPVDLGLRIHESMVNNFSVQALAGMIVTEERAKRVILDVAGTLPEAMQSDEEAEPWAVHLAEGQPLFVSFDDNAFHLVFRGQSYTRGESTYPAMDVTAEYRIERTPGGPKAVRQGPLAIFPPGFDAEGGRRLSVREQVVRDMLQRRFEKLLPPEIIPKPIELPEPWGKVGKLTLSQWETRDGWMVLSWKRPQPSGVPDAGPGR